jgi:oxygen-dependent protoporphyrinogen oxidase
MGRQLSCCVVGAGMAGLTAAWWLRRLGILPLVLEAEPYVGGRTRSVLIDGCRINTGAAFFTSFYHETLSLCATLDVPLVRPLIHPSRAGSARQMVTPMGRVPYAPARPLALLRFPLVDMRQKGRLLKAVAKIVSGPSLHIAEPESLAPFDDGDAIRWARQEIGEQASDYFVRPAIEPFFYAHASLVSAAVACALLGHAVRWRLSTPENGVDALARSLADTVDVRLGCRVLRLHREKGAVVIDHDAGSLRADAVILSIPPHEVLRIAPQIEERDSQDLMSRQRYEPNLALFLGYRRKVPLPSPSTTVGGPGAHRLVGLTAHSHGGTPGFIPPGREVISILAMGERSRTLLASSQATVERAVREDVRTDLELELPPPDWTHMVRRQTATVVPGPGSLRQIAAFSRRRRSGVHFAGDWLSGTSTVEGAVRTGRRAALAVLEDLGRGGGGDGVRR